MSSGLARLMAQTKWEDAVSAKKTEIGEAALAWSRGKVTVKNLKAALDLSIEEMDELVSGGWEAFLPKEEKKDGHVVEDSEEADDGDGGDLPVAADSGNPNSGDAVAADWESRSLVELIAHGAPKSTIEKLMDLGHDTIGRFERLRADISTGREKWPKGIGEAKVTALENAVTEWLTKNRDAATFAGLTKPVAEGEVQTPVEQPAEPSTAATAEADPENPATVEAKAEPTKRGRKKKETSEPVVEQSESVEPVVEQPIQQPESVEPASESQTVEHQPANDESIPSAMKWPEKKEWEGLTRIQRQQWCVERSAILIRDYNPKTLPGLDKVYWARGRVAANTGRGLNDLPQLDPSFKLDSFLFGWANAIKEIESKKIESAENSQPDAAAKPAPVQQYAQPTINIDDI